MGFPTGGTPTTAPLPTGAATETKQDAGNTLLDTISNTLIAEAEAAPRTAFGEQSHAPPDWRNTIRTRDTLMQRGFPTHPESLTNLTNTLLGAPILYQPVMLAQLGPDITGGGFGTATWAAANWIGTHTVGSFIAFGSPDLVGGYIAQQDEVIEQITLYASNGPSAQSTVSIWKKPTGGPFADTLQTITVPLGAERTYYNTPLSLTKGDVLAFYLDAGDPDWVVIASGIVVWGLRRMA